MGRGASRAPLNANITILSGHVNLTQEQVNHGVGASLQSNVPPQN